MKRRPNFQLMALAMVLTVAAVLNTVLGDGRLLPILAVFIVICAAASWAFRKYPKPTARKESPMRISSGHTPTRGHW